VTGRRATFVVLGAVGVVVALIVVIVVVKVGGKVVHDSRDHGSPVPIASANLVGSGPGTLVSAMTLPDLTYDVTSVGVNAARVVYRSTEGDDDTPSVVSGTVFTPKATPPPGGWPVVAYGHGTTGVNEPCAPSLSNTLLGQAPLVAGLIKQGFAVALPDYQGLGADGVHPYLDARTAGLNLIDAVRALRATFPDVSTRWAAFGGSQGGGAVWAANEEAAGYAPELTLVGSVALSPAADVTGLVDKARRGTLTEDQAPVLQWALVGLARLHADLNLDDFRRGVAARDWDALSACTGPLLDARTRAAKELGPNDLSPSTPAAATQLTGYLEKWALPHRRLSAPMSIVYGGKDTYIDPEWTTAAIARACALGGTLQWRLEPDKGHGDIDADDQLQWLGERFEGKPVTDECS
jgi:dienelactone hydrolase